jgi:hypothetical protein
VLKSPACALALAGAVALSTSARAASVTYKVVGDGSSLTLSGSVEGFPANPQSPGADVARWSGVITGDLTGGVFTFTGGSSITALVNPAGPFSTAPYVSVPGGDNYGVIAAGNLGFPYGNSTVRAAYRHLTLDIVTGTATHGGVPTGMTFRFVGESRLDYGVQTQFLGNTGGVTLLDGVNGTNTSPSLVSLDPATGYSTLALPVRFQTTGDNNRVENWTGTITALAAPSPATLNITRNGAGVDISCPSQPGYDYQLESSATLDPADWLPASGVTPSGFQTGTGGILTLMFLRTSPLSTG